MYETLFGDIPIIATKNKTKFYMSTWRIWTSCPQVPQPRARDLGLSSQVVTSKQPKLRLELFFSRSSEGLQAKYLPPVWDLLLPPA